mgnify:FL=1
MSLAALLGLGAFGIVVGGLIGAVGVGGVLLVPFLVYVLGMEVHAAIAATMFSYLFSGGVGAMLYARHGSIRWGMAGWLCLAAMPAAFLGALAVSATPGNWLELLIAVLVIFAGVNALRSTGGDGDGGEALGGARLGAIGAITGFGSAMSGTGGPLILVPILLWLEVPVLTAVGLSQAIQVPIAALATIGNFTFGRIDFAIAAVIAVALILGVAAGARLAHKVSHTSLRRFVAWILMLTGVSIAAGAVF